MTTPGVEETLEQIAERITLKVAKICGCNWTQCTNTREDTKAAILSALRGERDRCARILSGRADELQSEWDAPPSASNGFIAMTADTPAGYATYYAMNQFRKLAAAIREGR